MAFVSAWYQLFSICTLLLALSIAWRAWAFHPAKGSRVTSFLMLAVAWWSLAAIFEISTHSLDGKLFWVRVEYPGIVVTPVLLYLLLREYFGQAAPLSRRALAGLFVVPVLTVLLHWTNAAHHLMYTEAFLEKFGDISVVHFVRGHWFWVYYLYIGLLTLLGIIHSLHAALNLHPLYRKQMVTLLASAFLPIFINLIYVFHLQHAFRLDVTPLALSITGLVIVWGMTKYQFLDITPVARNLVFERLADGILVIDENHRVVDCNQTAALLLRVAIPKIVGQPLSAFHTVWPSLTQLELGSCERSVTLQSAVLSEQIYECHITPLHDSVRQRGGWLMALRDITERQRMETELHQLAYYDALTGLPNRVLFHERLEHTLTQARRLQATTGLVFIDIDGFKEVNDEYGHSVGDDVLRAVAGRLLASVRESDTVARFAGDEFVIILPMIHGKDDLLMKAQQILDRFQAPIALGALHFNITPSMGLALAPGDGQTVESLLMHADIAMYQAKQRGKNTFVAFGA